MIRYRKAKKNDILFLFRCHSEKAVAERASLIQENIYDVFYKDYISIMNNDSFHVYILEDNHDRVGFIKLHETNKRSKEIEGSIWICKKRGQGYGLNAVYLLLYISFEKLKYRKIWGWVRENNKPMHAMCKKLGIRVKETSMRPAWKKDVENHLEKIFYYEISLEEYILKKDFIMQNSLRNIQNNNKVVLVDE